MWSIVGAPGAAFVVAEALYRALDVTGLPLLMTTFVLVGVASWLVFRTCGFDAVRSITYALISFAPAAVMFAVYAHSVTGNLN